MTRIIRNARIEEDHWTRIDAATEAMPDTPSLPSGPILVPLALWQAQRAALIARGTPVGVWLDAGEDAAALANDLSQLDLIAVNFPKFTDGRGYSSARTLRERYGYRGELRAIGDVLLDQLFFMHRCGFDAFAVRADTDIERALAGLHSFSDSYQGAVDTPLPHFRRGDVDNSATPTTGATA
ncbi:DUF934 domain-containing protein [Rhodocyclus gracilis]|uniref:DUF934 domain-containing protein n=1 Tax=Rhodocyclus tenuis TaxID=1066 RepID=A0A6L5JXA5_RHOTE|nr:DUF934 domain-containing protein [Rhodocyclus gracilis]MQY51220.1 DUF934 domain-containing protein [Rhodocyclus gracilis]